MSLAGQLEYHVAEPAPRFDAAVRYLDRTARAPLALRSHVVISRVSLYRLG